MASPVRWRRLGPSHVTAEAALTRGVELLEATAANDPPTLAWWQVAPDALVLGRGSRVAPDEAARAAAGVSIVRRSSGGGPVLWDSDLLGLDVIVPRGHALYSDDVVASYRWLGEALAGAITALGAPARALTPEEARRDPGELGDLACFASRSPWEVVVGDRKVVGLSQVRRRTGTLLQAGIALGLDGPGLVGLLRLTDDERGRLEVALTTRAAGLNATGTIDADAVIAALEAPLSGTVATKPGGR